MAYLRPSRADYDAWEELGNPGWGWDGLLPYFKKSSTFLPPSPEAAREWNMTYNPKVWSEDQEGPVHVTIPDFQYQDMHKFWNAWKEFGVVEKKTDYAAGEGPGVYWNMLTIDRRDQTRTTSRKAYYDPVYRQRPNLILLTKHRAVEILFSEKGKEKLEATGVKITSLDTNTTTSVFIRKELILAAGAVQTPHLLQLSGLGPKEALSAAGVPVKKDIPSIGANLQDHPSIYMSWNISNQTFPNPDTINQNATYNASVFAEYFAYKTGPIAAGTASIGVQIAFPQLAPNLSSVPGTILSQNALDHLPAIYRRSDALLKGYLSQRSILASRYAANTTGVTQFGFLANSFSSATFLKPLSRGTITLNASNPSGHPVVQYNTLSNPVDLTTLISNVRFARRFWNRPTSSLRDLHPIENRPGAQYQSNEELKRALTTLPGLVTPGTAHLSGTTAMAPEEKGGVVGSDLRVYGVGKLRIVDAGVFPLIVGGPLQATVYAVAEKAADLILKGK
jgi:choline dehydrogenase-like flavoprotein